VRAPEPTPESGQRFALIELDEVALLLPQSDLHGVEPVLDVDARLASGGAAGKIRLRTGLWPVFCPSDDLEPLAQMLPKRRICAMLLTGNQLFGLVCSRVGSVLAPEVKRLPLPECMSASSAVLGELGLHAGRIVCVTSSARLLSGFGYAGGDLEITRTGVIDAAIPV
jgi:hypothetical protein